MSYACALGPCSAPSRPPPPTNSVTLVPGDNSVGDMTINIKPSGPRADGIFLGAAEELFIDSTEGGIWTASSLSAVDSSRLVFQPQVTSSSVTLRFTQLLANDIKLAKGTIIVFKFGDDYRPVHGTKFVTGALAAKNFDTNPADLGFRFSFPLSSPQSVRDLNAVATHKLAEGRMGRMVLESTIEFFDESMVTRPTLPVSTQGSNGGKKEDELPIAIIAGASGGGVAVLLLVVVCTVCIVRKARREARTPMMESASMGNLKSARQEPDDYKSTVDHDISAFDESRSTRNGNYDVAPTVGTGFSDARTSYVKPPSSTSSGHTISGAMPLPPKASDFEHSVYAAVPEALRKENDPWEIDFNELVMGKVLGEGAYGTVSEATFRGRKVAVKQLHQSLLKPNDIKSFKKEAKLMKSLAPHANVVQLLAVNTDEERPPLFIVTEYCAGGACDSYLKKYGHLLSQSQRISMMVAACRGVMHLHAQSIIHRDLACRNFLLTAEGGLKVADFGMSRDTTEDGNQTKCDVGPLRYMAPESMARKTYSIETDCWAFGVVMWEIESNAATPYGDMALTMVAIGVAKEGLRLSQPNGCPDELYALMHRCWQHKPEDRPAFADIDEQLLAIDGSL